ncbi:hypothetical protein GCM10009760_25990 [Kitasatospora kazusensis]|uniref:Uncharacterized protein n=1 Tax=Kitasatospora kazusensis TaxID=407974 RepID=A0ABN2ZFX6_9ACTN
MGMRVNWMQNGSYTAETDRLLLSSLFASNGTFLARSGVLAGGGEMAVTAQSTPNMTVAVATGQCVVQGTMTATQGDYVVTADSAFNLTVATADATNPRIDLVCVVVQDSFYSGATDAASVQIITGAAAPTPTAPAPPGNSCTLAQITVPAGATTITAAVIADVRQRTTARGGIIPALATSRPANVSTGQAIYETDTGRLMVWSGTAWTQLSATAAAAPWTAYTPAWTGVTLGASVAHGRYRQIGKTVDMTASLEWGTGASIPSGQVTVSLPTPASSSPAGALGWQGVGRHRPADGNPWHTLLTHTDPGFTTAVVWGLRTADLGWAPPGDAGYTFSAAGASLRVQLTYEAA